MSLKNIILQDYCILGHIKVAVKNLQCTSGNYKICLKIGTTGRAYFNLFSLLKYLTFFNRFCNRNMVLK